MANQADIAIKVTADTTSAENGLNQFKVHVQQTGSKLDSVVSTLGKFGVASFGVKSVSQAFAALKNAVEDCVQTFAIQEQAEAKLNATLQATSNTIGMSSDELKSLASSLQSVTTYGDETIIGMESLFISTQKIGRDILPEVTERALDMAAALGTDATSAAQSLARALADPINNLRVLKSSNILLTEAQQDQIKSLQEQGDLLSAQKIILAQVEKSYGGIARSIAETDTGKLTQLQNLWGDIKESMGQSLLNTISPALDILYASMKNIYDLVEEVKGQGTVREQAEKLMSEGNALAVSASNDDVLQEALSDSGYMKWKIEAERSGYDTSDKELLQRGIQADLFTQKEIDMVEAILAERNARKEAAKAAEEQRKALEDISLLDEKLLMKQSGGKTATESIIIPEINKEIEARKEEDRARREERDAQLAAYSNTINEFLGENTPLTDSEKRIKELNSLIGQAQNMRWSADSEQKAQLESLIAIWEQEKLALESGEEVVEKAKMTASEMTSAVTSSLTSIVGSFSDIWSNIGDQFESQLEKLTKTWDKFFDNLERKQDAQKDSLSMALSQGLISYEEYVSARQDLDDEYDEKQKQAEQEKESLRKKADAAKKAAFEADKVNAIAQIGISAAQAIMNAWKYEPITAGILTGLISATSVAQIAAVSSKQYTPLAAGGIVSSPTHALIGEGGSKEAILPLNEDSFRKAGLVGENGSKIVLNFNFGNVYSKEELTSDIFEAVEMAQRTGALPNWSYVG